MKKERRTRRDRSGEEKKGSITEEEETEEKDLTDLQHEELSGSVQEEENLTQTETDEDADEGLGDGNLGKSREDIFGQ